MDNTVILSNYKNFSTLSIKDRKVFKKFIDNNLNKNALGLPFGAKVHCVLHGMKEPPLCEECGMVHKNWQHKNTTFGKFCSRKCVDNASQYGSSYEKNVRTIPCNLDLLDYYHVNLSAGSLVKLHMREPEFYSGLCKLTEWLPYDAPIGQRIWHLLNGAAPSCKECMAEVEWNHTTASYNTYCSPKCSNNSSIKKEKTKESVQNLYGVDSVLNLPQTKKGLLKFRKDNPTSIRKYRVAESDWQIKHDTSHIMKVSEYASVVGYIRQENLYGTDVTRILSDIDALTHMHYVEEKSLTQIGNELNVPVYTISKQFKKLGIEVKNYYKSIEEDEVANFITSLGITVDRNNRATISGELDILIPDMNIAIEYCGLYWHSNVYKDNLYHYTKWKKCQEAGIRLITIFQNEWKYQRHLVERKLQHIFGVNDANSKVYARNTTPVHLTDVTMVKQFLDTNHIQGYVGGKHYYGLLHGVNLVAVMVIQDEGDYLNLARFATSIPVIGGFTKLLKHFRTTVSHLPIKTFADMRWDTGDIYANNGFEFTGQIKPDYYYIKNDKLFHKFNFRHKQLSKMSGYDKNLSESKNAQNMNLYKIYDCGKKRFILR